MISKDFLPLFFSPKSVPGASPKRKVGGSNPFRDAMKKAIAKEQLLFLVIFALQRVILLRSDIQLFAE